MHEMDNQTTDRSAIEPWRWIIELGLILTATTVLLSRPYLLKAIRVNEVAPEWLFLGPSIFLLLFVAYLVLEWTTRRTRLLLVDYIHICFGLMVIALIFPSSVREYSVRKLPEPMSLELLQKFSTHKDARIRVLALMAASSHIDNKSLGALLHQGLVDKDPLVQQAAKLVIEKNFGITIGNDAQGLHQVQSIIDDADPRALLLGKGSLP